MNKEIEIPEGYEAKIEGNKVILELKDKMIPRLLHKLLCAEVTVGQFEKHGLTVDAALYWLEKQEAKEDYDRMAPIYRNIESFEFACEKAWKFYNDSGSSTADGCEDNAIELAFVKGFREGFLCEEAQNIRVDKLTPSWDEERQAVFIPIINKYLDAKCSEEEMTWEEAMAYAKKASKRLPSQHEMFAILFFKNEINVILKGHGGDFLTEMAWTSTELSDIGACCVNFMTGFVNNNNKRFGVCVRAISD